MIIRLCDKWGSDYDRYSLGFHSIFDSKYFIEQGEANPFKAKDNVYFFAEDDDGELMGALNIIFLKKGAFERLKEGLVEDDMFLTVDDVCGLDACVDGEPKRAYFSTIYVMPAYRRCGVAHTLFRYGIDWLNELPKEGTVEYLAYCINESSRDLSIQHGLVEIGKNLNNEWIMWKRG